MSRGVPQAVRRLTHPFTYNDLDSLEQVLKAHPGEFAAVIMEPMNFAEPAPGFLAGVRDLAHAHGALFIFDEIITGFRFHLGGAQTLFGVTPDLATFGKSMANGMPIAALVGRRDLMKVVDEIFFSFTFGGEALSIAAALATIRKMRREPVIRTLWERGQAVMDAAGREISAYGLGDVIALAGKPCWSHLQFRDAPGASLWAIKSLFLQEVLERGVLTAGSQNICFAHTEQDVTLIGAAYDAACCLVAEGLRSGNLKALLRGEELQPIFRVR